MHVIGITGGVGAGKSEILEFLSSNYDAVVIKADEVGMLLMKQGESCYLPVVRLFGNRIVGRDGELDRKMIAELIFNDPSKREQMNAIIHPAVKEYIRDAIEQEREQETSFVFVEAALLIEDHYDEICDELWYIYAGERIRRQRLRESRGYSDEKISSIFAAQLSVEQFAAHCDFEISNNGDFAGTELQIRHRMKMYEAM